MSAHIFRSGTYMKVKGGFQALPADGGSGAAPVGGGGSAVATSGEIELPEGIAARALALVAAGILVAPTDGDLAAKWIAGEALAAGDEVGDAKAGEADAKGVGDGNGASCCPERTLSTEPPLANSRLEATSFTSPGSFADISTVPLL